VPAATDLQQIVFKITLLRATDGAAVNTTERYGPWRRSNREAALRLSYRCRGHELRGGVYVQAGPVHHAFQRGAHVAEPLASHWTLLVPLCLACHLEVHREHGLRELVQRQALERAAKFWNWPGLWLAQAIGDLGPEEPLWCARRLEKDLRLDGTWAALEDQAEALRLAS
jgi:hypothetical protein